MKALKLTVFAVLGIGLIGFVVLQLRSGTVKILSYSECDQPVSYKLGALDPKFGLSQGSVVADIQNAADIWSNAYGKTLFINSSKDAITINFIYDQRSALSTNIDQLQNQLDQKTATIQQQINSYNADVKVFEQKLADFNAQVAKVNQSGGANPDVYKSLIDQQNQLNAEGDDLNTRARQLNLATHDYNSKVQTLDQNVNQFNQALTQNSEEGLYDKNTKTISVYFADNYKELIHTLAHEFGHVLGMQHTDDPNSIMYANTSTFLSVTSQDEQQLAYVCREQSLFSYWLQEFAAWLHSKVSFLPQVTIK